MINIKDLRPSHISFMLGMWQQIMGGEGALEYAVKHAEKWCEDLCKGENFPTHVIGSRWDSNCDICLAVNHQGGVYVLTCQTVANLTSPDVNANMAAEAFMSAAADIK